jgi:hypothetical protein
MNEEMSFYVVFHGFDLKKDPFFPDRFPGERMRKRPFLRVSMEADIPEASFESVGPFQGIGFSGTEVAEHESR